MTQDPAKDPTLKVWFVHLQGKQEGPFSQDEIRQKLLARSIQVETFAWRQGMKDWAPLGNIEAFNGLFTPKPPATPPPSHPLRRSGDLSVMMEFNRTAPDRAENTQPISKAEIEKAKREVAQALKISEQGRREAEGLTPVQRLLRIALVAVALVVAIWVYLTFFAAQPAHAAEAPAQPIAKQAAPAAPKSERIDVDKIKDKYWTNSEAAEVRVVQNRLYSKARKFELGLLAGSVSTDPFLSVRNVGGFLSYHLTEYFSVGALGWKYLVSPSSALSTLQQLKNVTANTNEPKNFLGGEAAFSPVYGKLSILGQSIMYFDTQLVAGGGMTATETGSYVTPFLGLGGQVYLSKLMTLRLDYRLSGYSENIQQKNLDGTLGAVLDSRLNLSGVVTLGLTFLLGPL
jgi:outer membrane beta-barrel protein